MTKIFQITKHTQSMLDEWQHKARLDEAVWPYLSFTPRYEYKSADSGDDWEDIFIMDERGVGLLQFSPDRNRNNHEATVSMWVLSDPAKKLIAGRLFQQIPVLADRLGVTFIQANCHKTNNDSQYLLRRRFGAPWGVCEQHAWNGKLGKWEASVHFRIRTTEWGKVFRD
jgi:hypothetical protein